MLAEWKANGCRQKQMCKRFSSRIQNIQLHKPSPRMVILQIKCIHNTDYIVNKVWMSREVARYNYDNQSPTIETLEDVPMRVAPALIIAIAVSRSRMPPDALTPANCLTVSRIS